MEAAIPLQQLVDCHRQLQASREAHDCQAMKAALTALYRYHPLMCDLAASKMGILVAQLAKEKTCLPVRVHAQTLLAKWMLYAQEEGIRPVAPNVVATKSHRHHPYARCRPHRQCPAQAICLATAGVHPDAEAPYAEADRNVMVSRLLQVFALPLEPPVAVDVMQLSLDIESALHCMFAAEHGAEQKLIKFHQLMANLHHNVELRRAVLLGHTSPQRLVHMHAWELGKWEARHEAHVKAQEQEVVAEEDTVVDTLGPPDLSRQ
eukprot:GGOE01047451.1.p2 GENE.GGOE01047451.1~~GGOE01047451.1.p2  ORF type:complete len:274 (-),score=74.62 GGOE01047451.1:1058-1846(-)